MLVAVHPCFIGFCGLGDVVLVGVGMLGGVGIGAGVATWRFLDVEEHKDFDTEVSCGGSSVMAPQNVTSITA